MLEFPKNDRGMTVQDTTYQQLAKALKQSDAMSEPSETHGTLSGLLAAAPEVDWRQEWFRLTVQGGQGQEAVSLPAAARPVLDSVYLQTQAALSDLKMSFEPMVPPDDEPLQARVQALGLWCQGFLFGFSTARPGSHDGLSPQVREVLDDLQRLAQVEIPGGEGDEGDEAALMEIVEYVRVAAQLVHDELRLKSPDPANQTRH